MITILSSVSARPNFVKLAAVHHALAGRDGVKHIIVHTGQHHDPLLSDIFFRQLGIPQPDENLGVKGGADREGVIQATADAMEPVLKLVHPDCVLVYGDVSGAVGAARAAKKHGMRLGHVEAGLRSGDLSMPEEHNRIEIDRLADELFVSERSGVAHLKEENVQGTAHFVGNTMVDTLIRMRPAIDAAPLPEGLPKRFGVVTLHRPGNVDSPETLKDILAFLREVAALCPLVLPLHLRTKANLEQFGLQHLLEGPIRVTQPLGYIEFLRLVSEAQFVLTDSGGIQEEATFLKKRCFTLRRNTERPSTVESGSNVLVDPANVADRKAVLAFAKQPATIAVTIPQEWDGKAGQRIADAVATGK